MAEHLKIIIGAKDEFSGAFGKLHSFLPSLKTLSVSAGVAIAGTATALIAVTKSTAEAYDKIQKFSDRIGISTDALSKYHHVANLSGVSTQTLEMGFQRMTRRISETAQGTGVAGDALKELGISIDSIAEKKPDEQFEMIAAAMEGLNNQSDKTRIAMKLFDSEGVALLQTMTDGADGIKAMKEEAEKFGLVISAQAGADAAMFNDALLRVTSSFTGLKNSIAEEVMPILTGLANKFADFVVNNRAAIIDFAEKFVKSLGTAFEFGAYAVAGLIDAFKGLQMIWEVLKIASIELNMVLWEGIQFITDKIVGMMEALNFRGIFDDAIAGAENFKASNTEMVASLESMAATSKVNLQGLIDEGLAIDKVTAFSEKVKGVIEELKAAGSADVSGGETGGAVQGVGLFNAANLEQTKKNIEELKKINDEYFMSGTQKTEAWYETEKELLAGHTEELSALDTLYLEKKKNLRLQDEESQIEAFERLNELHDNYFQTKSEALDEWYLLEQEKFTGNQEALAAIEEVYQSKRKKIQHTAYTDMAKILRMEVTEYQSSREQFANIASAFGKEGFEVMKGVAIAESTIFAIQGAARAMADYTYPISLVIAALALASGMASVAKISSTKYSAAHGGLDYVPKEQTYLLDRGERVLSPRQNEDLTGFLQGEGEGSIMPNITLEVLPNVTNPDAMLYMDKADWREVIEEKIYPAMRELNTAGITI